MRNDLGSGCDLFGVVGGFWGLVVEEGDGGKFGEKTVGGDWIDGFGGFVYVWGNGGDGDERGDGQWDLDSVGMVECGNIGDDFLWCPELWCGLGFAKCSWF